MRMVRSTAEDHVDIAVIGTGYVGLVTGAGLADFGNDVTCCDIDERKIDALNRGEIPIYEPGLDTIVSRNVAEGRLRFTTNLPEAIAASRAIFIAVGTPPKPDGSADLHYVEDVARAIARYGRIGPKFLQAGPGFGGSCFPKDTSALADIARRHEYEFQLIEAVLRVNQSIKERMVGKVAEALDGEIRGKTIAVLGLAF